MKRTYKLGEAVHGTHGVRFGHVVEFAFDAGEVVPADADEAAVLEHLVAIGQAELVTAKPKKKEA